MTVSISLPDKHIQIITYLSEGLTQKEIAHRLSLTNSNVERIIAQYIALFDCRNAAGLVAYSIRKGIIK